MTEVQCHQNMSTQRQNCLRLHPVEVDVGTFFSLPVSFSSKFESRLKRMPLFLINYLTKNIQVKFLVAKINWNSAKNVW